MKKRITLIVFSVLIMVALYVLYCFNYIPHKKYTNADFNIEAYKSNIDKDNDGIDDQTDILNLSLIHILAKKRIMSLLLQNMILENSYAKNNRLWKRVSYYFWISICRGWMG